VYYCYHRRHFWNSNRTMQLHIFLSVVFAFTNAVVQHTTHTHTHTHTHTLKGGTARLSNSADVRQSRSPCSIDRRRRRRRRNRQRRCRKSRRAAPSCGSIACRSTMMMMMTMMRRCSSMKVHTLDDAKRYTNVIVNLSFSRDDCRQHCRRRRL
jgi:hypothetical protein